MEKDIENHPELIADEDKRWELQFRLQMEKEEKEEKARLK
jgi:hypothetical protein